MAVVTQSRKKTFPVEAPFLGLDEKQDPSALAPNRPRALKNILLHRKRMELRPGYDPFGTLPAATGDAPRTLDVIEPGVTFIPWQMKEVLVGKGGGQTRTLFALAGDAHDIRILLLGTAGDYVEVSQPGVVGLQRKGSIVVSYPHLYVLLPDTTSRPYWTRIDNPYEIPAVQLAGIGAPRQFSNAAVGCMVTDVDGIPRGVYALGISLYDADTDAESNGIILNYGEYLFADQDECLLAIYFVPAPLPDRVTHVRVYMAISLLDADPETAYAGGELSYRLVAEVPKYHVATYEGPKGPSSVVQLNGSNLKFGIPGTGPALSVRGVGPFLPTRNGAPPRSRYALPYQGRMLWAAERGDYAGFIYPSALDHPEHVSLDDRIGLPDGSRDATTAMIEYQGRAVIFTERAVYVISGTIVTQTNKGAALGVDVPIPTYQFFRTQSDVGCINTHGGDGVIEIAGFLYFNGPEGLYRFDGLRSVKVSHAVDEIIRGIPDRARRSCTMANDERNGILWICYADLHALADYDGNVVLAYHYRQPDPETGFGTWTEHDFPSVTCVTGWTKGDYLFDVSNRYSVDSDGWFLVGTSKVNTNGDEGVIGLVHEDAFIDNDADEIEGVYETGWLDLGLASRAKRFHHLTLDIGNDNDVIPRLSVVATVETLTGPDTSVTFDLPESGTPKRLYKFKLNMRGTRLKLKFTGHTDSSHAQMRLNGFAVEAEPLGHR